MKNLKLISFATLACVAAASQATIYSDALNDEGLSSGSVGTHMDITSVEVTNTLSTISFKFTVQGDLVATNWGKYNVVLRSNNAANIQNGPENNAWGRNYTLLGGASGFIGSWVDQPTDNQLNYSYNGSWVQNSQVTNSVSGTNMVTLTANLADLGIAVGDIITFDAVSTGGGDDTAIDSLTGAKPDSWGQVVDLEGLQYEVVPEPATMALLGIGAAALLRRKKKA